MVRGTANTEVNGGEASAVAEAESDGDFVGPRRRTSQIHKAFDGNGCCKLPPGVKGICDGKGRCGFKPKKGGGTSNYWSHLLVHHPDVYLLLKGEGDQLSEVGKEKLATTLMGLTNDTSVVKKKLTGAARKVLDDLCADLILEERLAFDIGTRPGFKALFGAATDEAWTGVGSRHVEGRRLIQGTNGRETARVFKL